MLHTLFGSKSVTKILFFLLVNETCYASQLHRVLGTPLTPIQKALERLEKKGILESQYAGKTRLFSFNPEYPLLSELERLLKKAYSLMGPSEKKEFYYIRHTPGVVGRQKKELLETTWSQMRRINNVSLEFRSSNKAYGRGTGTVEVIEEKKGVLITRERGTWLRGEEEFRFCNTFLWTLNRHENLISLEHLRLGPKNPVFLFHLSPVGDNHFESLHAHLCQNDTYFGALLVQEHELQLTWRILGPQKNDEIYYRYC